MRIDQFRFNRLLIPFSVLLFVASAHAQQGYQQKVLEDAPAFYWSMDQNDRWETLKSTGTVPSVFAVLSGGTSRKTAGPRPEEFPDFSEKNAALSLKGAKQWLVVRGEAGQEKLKFRNGDAITIEAWVNPENSNHAAFPYIVGKGRTYNPGFNQNNQNYALRLMRKGNYYVLSFYFVDEDILKGGSAITNGHRWRSKRGFLADKNWHHVAISYRFGEPESITGYIDGKPSSGTWELAGATRKNPIVDDDELWIGAAMKGGNHFQGAIDELAIHRKIISAQTMAGRYRQKKIDYLQKVIEQTAARAPKNRVAVDVYEGITDSRNWNFRLTKGETVYQTPAFALTKLPFKYNARGIIADRDAPWLVHAYSTVQIPKGEHEFVLRSLNAARIYIDGKLQAETPFMELAGSAHGTMHKLQPVKEGELTMPVAHSEKRFNFQSDGKPHTFSLVTITGERGRPAFLGELVLAYGQPGETYQILGHQPRFSFNTTGWLAFLQADETRRSAWNKNLRREVSQAEIAYWENRHRLAIELIEAEEQVSIPEVKHGSSAHPIDRFIEAELKKKEIKPTVLIDDASYLRRLTLDLIGLNPTPGQIERFYHDSPRTRRENVIDRLLNSPAWADHWVAYWQDVLAENPGLTKPNLNNSGPFRWYLHDAFSDNRSFDRIVTELILMEGSRHNGGTAGFGIAANNDVPMAAKAHILGTAFLGIEMKCARCHDSPYHQSTQRDLFEIAAMLERKPVAVPRSSSVTATPEQIAAMGVTVTLKAGEAIPPRWPFNDLLSRETVLQQKIVRDPQNTREVLAAILTHPANKRFSRVIVNRLWKRLLGRGLVEPAEDWETGDASAPQLLDWLAQQFVRDRYDLKKLTRLIVTSNLYQRQVVESSSEQQKYFAGPSRKRLTAEQIVDSIYLAVGKKLPSERLTHNADGRQIWVNFIDLGRPKKSWEMVAISNERERPSMALPQAQSVVDLLSAYGWRGERQDPVTDRESTATALQPLALANGTLLNRAVDISDSGEIVEIALKAKSVEQLIDQFFLRILSRKPTAQEQKVYTALLSPGFESRVTGEKPAAAGPIFRSPLTWSFHFDPEAANEGIRQQILAEQGDPPTKQLEEKWRERAEDALWALFNTPEFMFVP